MYAFIILYQSGSTYLAGFNNSRTKFFNNYIKNTKNKVLERTNDTIIVKTDGGVLSSIITIKGIFLDNISNLYISIDTPDILKLMKGKK